MPRLVTSPITDAVTWWERWDIGPAIRADGVVVSAARSVDIPPALRLDFANGSVWFVAAVPPPPAMKAAPVAGDEIMVVFSADDATNHAVLDQMHSALVPGGRLVMDLNNITARLRDFQPSRVAARRGPHDLLVDRYHLDPVTSRLEVTPTIVREGRAREVTFVVRLFAFTELRDWLTVAGFTDIHVRGEDGGSLTPRHERMVVSAVTQ